MLNAKLNAIGTLDYLKGKYENGTIEDLETLYHEAKAASEKGVIYGFKPAKDEDGYNQSMEKSISVVIDRLESFIIKWQ